MNDTGDMTKKTFEKIVHEGIRFVARFFPQSRYLYFPLLSAALVWAIKSSREWGEEIFSWEVWLDPSFVKVKSDEFILNFFSDHSDLADAFAEEIQTRDMPALRKLFYSLYPIVGLEDPFLSGLFHQELISQNYRGIAQQYDVKIAQAIVDIEAVEEKGRFMEGLESIAKEMASFCADMITQASVQKALEEIINKELSKDMD
ncbi:MAG: hypothetical protein JSV17_02675 [Candidatus Aminicenantes bacterium]|nr:MAG: hypothetical protein JSV17_02675 [Candidatus Aminicenantes bacterium]